MRMILVALVAAMSIFATSAEARRSDGSVTQFCGDRVCGWFPSDFRSELRVPKRKYAAAHKPHRKVHRKVVRTPGNLAVGKLAAPGRYIRPQIIAHPAGCPPVRFCGCGLSVHFFGRPVREGGLAVAAEWARRFPRAILAAGTAVVTRAGGHVYGVLAVLGPRLVLAWDANSGRHQTKIHPRALRPGDVVVNPRARMASR
jgi:hypothetical protein